MRMCDRNHASTSVNSKRCCRSLNSQSKSIVPVSLTSPKFRIRHRLGAGIVVQMLPFLETIGVVDARVDREGGSDQGVGNDGNAEGVLAAWHDLPYR